MTLQKIKDLLSLGIASTVSSLLYGFFWLFLTTQLSNEEYGELGFLMSVANMGSVIALLGLGGTITVYVAKKENIFPSSFVIVLISSAITSAAAFILTQNVSVSLFLFGLAMFFVIIRALNGKKKYKEQSIHLILRAGVTIVISLIFLQFFGLYGILLGYFIATLFSLKELRSLLKNQKIDFSILKSKFNFTLFSYGNRISEILWISGDKILIGSLFSFSLLGNYFFAFQVLLLLYAIPRAILEYLIPQESEGKKNKKLKLLSVLAASLITVIVVIISPIGVMAVVPQYQDSIVPIQILSFSIIPLSISVIQQSEFLGKENAKFVLMGTAFQSGLYMILIVIIGQSYGINGMAYGFLAAAISRTIFNIILRHKISV